ncbi:hypothetical protein GWG54_11980 [Natronococcus sp. JC468]|uniref:hypothetical protein n=1 Tax=Natronococcus sp. JC468 TaxID=1961921 RepID=UPI00143AD2A0|nr:hypothetical protein [Natronococcus sp. JC468]NKE36528.1 hypothetical protein [Natronococcus sp. JC468]
MTKRRLERDLEDQRDLLEELSPDERLEVFLKAAADNRDDWLEALWETCPKHRYRMVDQAFTERNRVAIQVRQHAVYELHTTLLEFQKKRQRQYLQWVIDFNRDEDPDEETEAEASERAEQLQLFFGELYTVYHGYRQFSEEELGVALETWLGSYLNGDTVAMAVAETLEDTHMKRLATENLNPSDTEPDDEEWITLDDVATIRYEAHVEMWDDALDGL